MISTTPGFAYYIIFWPHTLIAGPTALTIWVPLDERGFGMDPEGHSSRLHLPLLITCLMYGQTACGTDVYQAVWSTAASTAEEAAACYQTEWTQHLGQEQPCLKGLTGCACRSCLIDCRYTLCAIRNKDCMPYYVLTLQSKSQDIQGSSESATFLGIGHSTADAICIEFINAWLPAGSKQKYGQSLPGTPGSCSFPV